MRIFIAALIAAVVIFIWQAIAHMMLPLGMMGFRLPAGEDPVLQSVASALPTSGIYLLPSLDPAKMGDKPTMDAWTEKAKKNPFVFAAVSPPQDDPATRIEIEGQAIQAGVPAEILGALKTLVPLGRAGTPEEAAGGVYLFCSPDSDYISGQVLIVGGGLSI